MWIETAASAYTGDLSTSRPIGACGLKPFHSTLDHHPCIVAPHRGVWIETLIPAIVTDIIFVAPHRGVWIETLLRLENPRMQAVAPHRGVWIETFPDQEPPY